MYTGTGGDASVVEAGITDPHRGQAPAPLRDRSGLGGAGVTEALPAGPAVVLGVVGLELLRARVACLHDTHAHTRTQQNTLK